MIDRDLVAILACPLCKVEVVLEEDWIVCTSCGRRFPIRNGIPIMLLDEAEGVEDDEADNDVDNDVDVDDDADDDADKDGPE